MGRYIIRRLLISVPTLLGVTILVFLFINLAPGDPVTVMLSPEQRAVMGPQAIQERKEALGLNKPLPLRYALWLKEVLRGNWGYSIQFQKPVLQRVTQRIGPTLRLTMAALLFSLFLGVPIGVISAFRQYSAWDYVVTVFTFVGVSIPVFFLGLGLIYVFALKLKVLPPGGMATVGAPPTLGDALAHLVLPAFILGFAAAAELARYTRASVLDVIRQDYLRTARAKGLRDRAVLARHALPNGLLPIITIVGLQLPTLLAGAVIVETVFAWPGMGRLTVEAIGYRDYPLLMGIMTMFAVAVLLSNLLADLAYAVVDPRIRYE
jgi:peptide/nickel transport system permease protein